MRKLFSGISLVVSLGMSSCKPEAVIEADAVVYGGTPGGITAVLAAGLHDRERFLLSGFVVQKVQILSRFVHLRYVRVFLPL